MCVSAVSRTLVKVLYDNTGVLMYDVTAPYLNEQC